MVRRTRSSRYQDPLFVGDPALHEGAREQVGRLNVCVAGVLGGDP
jgi:hypothetical protein